MSASAREVWWLGASEPARELVSCARRSHVELPCVEPRAARARLLAGERPSGIWFSANTRDAAEARALELRALAFAGALIAELPRIDETEGATLEVAGADEVLSADMNDGARAALLNSALRRARLRGERERALRELEGSHGELRKRHEELRAAFRELAHELRTPLTSAREFLEILLEGQAGPLEQQQREFLEISRRSCSQMNERLENLLDAARQETGKPRRAKRRARLEQVVHPLLEAFAPRAARAGVALRWKPARIAAFEFDPPRLAQALENLVGNALDFAPRGSAIEISARLAPTDARSVELRVADRGPGIEAHEAERLFERGTQRCAADAEIRGGLGLGLSIAREIAREHGGDLRVEKTPGGGATLVLSLPRAPLRRVSSALAT